MANKQTDEIAKYLKILDYYKQEEQMIEVKINVDDLKVEVYRDGVLYSAVQGSQNEGPMTVKLKECEDDEWQVISSQKG